MGIVQGRHRHRRLQHAWQYVQVVDMAGQLPLAETAVLLAHAKLFGGPDTAVAHIAVGASTIALYGPSNPIKLGHGQKIGTNLKKLGPCAVAGGKTM